MTANHPPAIGAREAPPRPEVTSDDVPPGSGPSVPLDPAQEALLELDRRGVGGIVLYLSCWTGIAGLSGMYGSRPALAWTTTFVLTAIAALRLVLHQRFPELVERAPRRARQWFVGLVLLNGVTVGVMAALAPVLGLPEAVQNLLVLVGGIVCSTSTMVMAIDPLLRIGMSCAVLGPYAASLLLTGDAAGKLTVVLVLVFAGYLFTASAALHRDYWTAQDRGMELRRRATQFQHLSETDPLTQVANRLSVDQRLAAEWSMSRRAEDRVSLLLVDLDHFKAVNDVHGHPAGDLCLRAAADALAASVHHRGDLVARWGGEEFLVLLPGTGPDDAVAVAERMRAAVAALRVPVGATELRLTCSIGVVGVSGGWMAQHSPSQAVALADQALYTAKAAGRDRVEVSRT